MARRGAVGRAASLVVLACALAAGLWRAEAMALAGLGSPPLISPRWQLGLPNTTSNFSATVPVTWELLVHDNSKRVVGSLPGYDYVQITAEHVEILAGTRGGLFHLRAVAKHCGTTTGVGCVGTSVWLVLSWTQFTMFGFGAAAAVGLCSFALLRRLQPPPELPESRNEESIRLSVMDEHYGTVSPQPPGRASPMGPRGGLPYGGRGAGPGGYAGGGAGPYISRDLGLPPGGYSAPTYAGRGPRGRMPVRTYDASGRLGPPRRAGAAGDTL